MYLASIAIENFRGIPKLTVAFNKDVNVIIGENGSRKTALIDAIRLLSNVGNQQKDIYVSLDDFFTGTDEISLTYILRGLSDEQKGAFHEYLVLDDDDAKNDHARVRLVYRYDGKKVIPSYYAGEKDESRASTETLALFRHCYLGALRDSTKDLLYNRSNILGTLIHRQVNRNKTEKSYEDLMGDMNEKLLGLPEVVLSRNSINTNLQGIFKSSNENHIGVRIEQKRSDYIVNIIKPFLPHDKVTLKGDGFDLRQNSLGYNNLIYIATVLGDINESIKDDKISVYSLLIEEPEAHLHPQLQLSLYHFLKQAKPETNSQLFITSHSPTVTSKVPLDNLILLCPSAAINIGKLMDGKDVNDVDGSLEKIGDAKHRKAQLERYVDVTKSQLFFAKGVFFVEGISEDLLVPVFCRIMDKSIVDYLVEIVNVDGTSFYPFLSLFIGEKSLPIKAAVITDDDRFTKSKDSKYSFDELIGDANVLKELKEKIEDDAPCKRISNIEKYVALSSGKLSVHPSYKTFEFALINENTSTNKKQNTDNLLLQFIGGYIQAGKKDAIKNFVDGITGDTLTDEQRFHFALLYWKAVPSKAQFAQDLAIHLEENMADAKTKFVIPQYIRDAIVHLIPNRQNEF